MHFVGLVLHVIVCLLCEEQTNITYSAGDESVSVCVRGKLKPVGQLEPSERERGKH